MDIVRTIRTEVDTLNNIIISKHTSTQTAIELKGITRIRKSDMKYVLTKKSESKT
jgi:hypothetical protein